MTVPVAIDPTRTDGVPARRVIAWLVDVVIVAVLLVVLHLVLGVLGLVTFGLGWGLMPLLSLVPFLYSTLALAGRHAATPGQRWMALTTVDHVTGRRPSLLEAAVSTGLFLASLWFPPILLLALFTARHRTLHDVLSGLVMVHATALTALPPGRSMDGGFGPRGTSAA